MHNVYSRLHKITFLLLLALLTGGCIHRAVIKPDSRTEKVLTAISGAIAENDILSAMAQIDLITPHGYHPVRAAIAIKKPSYLRLELLPIIGTPDFFLAASPAEMCIFIPSRGEFYRGKPTAANLARFLPWQFNIEDIVMIFTGAYPPLIEGVISCQSYQENNSLRIEMKSRSDKSQILWVGENNRLLKLASFNEFGQEIYHVNYEDYRPEIPIPGKITINMADGITSVSLKYSELKIEKAATLTIFDLKVPEGVQLILLD